MHPLLFKIGPISLHTYGLFVALGFLAGIYVSRLEATRNHEDPEKIVDLAFYILIGTVLGARGFFVLTELSYYLKHPIEILWVWKGGLVFYGGFIGAFVFAFAYLKKHGMNIWKTADILAPGLAAGHFLGRIGCFFAGCCYGKSCDLPWAVKFTDALSLAPRDVWLHPTQLYSSLTNLAIFAFLMVYSRRKKFHGQVFWTYCLVYGIARSLLEIFRGDPRGDFLFNTLSVSQTIGITFSVVSLFMLLRLKKSSEDCK